MYKEIRMDKELLDKYIKKMLKEIKNGDTESAHWNADCFLCEILEELGYKKLVDEYRKIHKWYA